jgi:hypothetical protein
MLIRNSPYSCCHRVQSTLKHKHEMVNARILLSKGVTASGLPKEADKGAWRILQPLVEAYRRRCVADGLIEQLNNTDTTFGACKILQGNIRDGLRLIEEVILKREKEGYRAMADLSRLTLAEFYLQIIAGNEKPPLPTLLRNLPTLLRNLPILVRVMVTAPSRIPDLLKRVLANPHFILAGHK